MANFETVQVETDLLILGGGMASCGAAVEAAYWAKKNGLKVTLVDKAAVDRSGAVAMGLSAINQYVGLKEGDNTVEDYVNYVSQDLMGVARDDLVPTSLVTSTVPSISSRSGACRSGRPRAAVTSMRDVGSS